MNSPVLYFLRFSSRKSLKKSEIELRPPGNVIFFFFGRYYYRIRSSAGKVVVAVVTTLGGETNSGRYGSFRIGLEHEKRFSNFFSKPPLLFFMLSYWNIRTRRCKESC